MINYYLITKPGIIMGNLITFAAGFLLASRGDIKIDLFIATLLGLGLIIASACVFNNYIDRHIDKKMERTKKRGLAAGNMKGRNALIFALFLGIVGNFTLFMYTNGLTIAMANVGFFIYVLIYSFIKCHTAYSTIIGSIAGAIPPVVGYCAVSNQFDMGATILFSMMILWQMPHFFSIALRHYDDYAKAEIPVLPNTKGIFRTKIHMVLYILVLIPTVALFTLFGYTGYLFLTLTVTIGLAWLLVSLKGFGTECDKLWGKQMFRLSLIKINTICLLIPIDFAL